MTDRISYIGRGPNSDQRWIKRMSDLITAKMRGENPGLAEFNWIISTKNEKGDWFEIDEVKATLA